MILTLGAHTAVIDDGDGALLDGCYWWAERRRNTLYVRGKCGQSPKVYLHRVLMGHPEGLVVDHINGDGLDNRRANLRLATLSQNGANSPNHKRGISRFRGVTFHKNSGLWRAQLRHQHIGYFKNEEDAARAYDQAAVVRYGDFAVVNGLAS